MFDVLIQRTNIGSNNQNKDKRKANDAAGKADGKKWNGMECYVSGYKLEKIEAHTVHK